MRCRQLYAVLVCLLTCCLAYAEYTPLTLDQAKAYMAAKPDQAAQDIVDFDAIQHRVPKAAFPGFEAVLAGGNLVWGFQGPLVLTWAAVLPGAPPPLQIAITLQGGEQKGFAPDQAGWILFWQIASAVTFVGGGILGYAIHP